MSEVSWQTEVLPPMAELVDEGGDVVGYKESQSQLVKVQGPSQEMVFYQVAKLVQYQDLDTMGWDEPTWEEEWTGDTIPTESVKAWVTLNMILPN